jgi:hypothetical protein
MNATIYRLLKGHLARSVWLYLFFGLMQLMFISAYWDFEFQRIPLFGTMLGVWGAAAASNMHSLVWRSVPLNASDANVVRWWSAAGLPGFFLTIVIGIAWVWRYWRGSFILQPSAIMEFVLAQWAVLGMFACVSPGAKWLGKRLRVAKGFILFTSGALALGYGLPIDPSAQAYALLFIIVGLVLLALSAVRASRATQWRWPEAPRQSGIQQSDLSPSADGYVGIYVVLVPLVKRSAILAISITSLLAALHWWFPKATVILFMTYLVIISTSGFLLTFQLRGAIQPLRSLPVTANRLAVFLEIIAVFPGFLTLLLAVLVNRYWVSVGIDVAGAIFIAIMLFSSQASLDGAALFQIENMPNRGYFMRKWFPVLQRLIWPAWFGLMVFEFGREYGVFSWFGWALVAVGLILCAIGHFSLVRRLKSGVRPSRNQDVFSAA